MEAGGYLPPVPECSWGSIPVPLAEHWSALGEAKAWELKLSPEGAELQEAVGDPADCGQHPQECDAYKEKRQITENAVCSVKENTCLGLHIFLIRLSREHVSHTQS